MFSKVIDNIPSIKNKKFNKINYLEKFNNLDKDIKIENFDDLLESVKFSISSFFSEKKIIQTLVE